MIAQKRLAAALAAALLTAGCNPEISKEEGFYSCTDGGTCPAGTTCRDDGTCHAGVGGVGDACDEGGPYCVAGLTCLQGDGDLMALEENRFCGSVCDTDGACPSGSQCIGGECLLSCGEETECAEGTDCRLPFLPDTDAFLEVPICVDIDEQGIEGLRACSTTISPDCMPPAVCLNDGTQGVCSLPCTDNDNCGMGGRCLLVDPMRRWSQCFIPCDADDECGMEGLVCRDTGLPRAGTVCMPAAWEGALGTVTYRLPQ